MDADHLRAKVTAELATVRGSDVLAVERVVERLGSQWREQTATYSRRIDDARTTLREALANLGLSPSRRALKERALHLDPFPTASSRIVKHNETYEVEIPRDYPLGLGRVFDWFLGVRKETRTVTTNGVDMAALKDDLRTFVAASSRKFCLFVKEQCETLRELYISPATDRRMEDEACLAELSSLRTAASAQLEALPGIVKQLEDLLRVHLPPKKARTAAARAGPRSAFAEIPKDGSSGSSPADGLARPALAPLKAILARAWESIAIQRFFEVAARAAGTESRLDEIVLIGPLKRIGDLRAFLTRSLEGTIKMAHSANSAGVSRRPSSFEEVVVSHAAGTTKLSAFPSDRQPVDRLAAACAKASALAVTFEAGQPSAGINLLLSAAYFSILREFSGKVFFVYADGALFDTRLHDLVVEVAPMVAKETGFGFRPWYVYEAARYDARYSNFMELSVDVWRSGASGRDLLRNWRQARLSMRAPFQEEVLTSAFAMITVGEDRRADAR